MPQEKVPELSSEMFKVMRDLICEISGISYPDNKKYLLENRIAERLKACNLKSYDEYYYLLKHDPSNLTELSAFFDAITTNETSFFRNPLQIVGFEKIVLPEILAEKNKKGSRNIKIWSAGCSTGEEPYTLAMIVAEILKGIAESWDVNVLATDISKSVLKFADKAVYNSHAFRNTPDKYKTKYFSNNGICYTVKDEIKKIVTKKYLNLADQVSMKMIKGMDTIFCRNVLIYFDDDFKKRVLSHFYESLRPGGYLFVGHSESLHRITKAFKVIHFKGALAYKKE